MGSFTRTRVPSGRREGAPSGLMSSGRPLPSPPSPSAAWTTSLLVLSWRREWRATCGDGLLLLLLLRWSGGLALLCCCASAGCTLLAHTRGLLVLAAAVAQRCCCCIIIILVWFSLVCLRLSLRSTATEKFPTQLAGPHTSLNVNKEVKEEKDLSFLELQAH